MYTIDYTPRPISRNYSNPKTRKAVTDCVKCSGLGCFCLQAPQPDGSQELKPWCWAMFAVPLFIMASVAVIAVFLCIIGILWSADRTRWPPLLALLGLVLLLSCSVYGGFMTCVLSMEPVYPTRSTGEL